MIAASKDYSTGDALRTLLKAAPATREQPKEHLKPGFQVLLQQVASKIVPGVALGAAVRELVTLGERQELAFGIQSLTALQRAVLDEAWTLPVHDAGGAEDGTWYLGQWSYGRIWLATEPPADPECRLLGAVSMPVAVYHAVLAKAEQIQKSWQSRDAEMHAFFDGLDTEGLSRVLLEVHDAVDHTDPILFYVGDETLTNFGKHNNLQERAADLPQSFRRRAKELPLAHWTLSEKYYVFCMHQLRVARCRGEEFCGRQLNPALLADDFDEQLARYRERAPQIYDEDAPSIADKARLLARCKTERAGDLLTYRWINGLNFYKEERLCSRTPASPKIDPALETYISGALGVDAARHESLASLFDACVAQMARRRFAGPDDQLNAVEALLQKIVERAIEATGSDVGMTRGTRDLSRLQRAFAEQRYQEICDWQPTDYFCAVFPSASMHGKLAGRPELLVKILYACAGRMTFNHWHYMPGHCPPESVPPDRHYYYPPRLPDMSVWTDQHHTGHTMAGVRYSIRSPAPLAFNGKVYPGLVDLRLFRQSGAPYGEEDLKTALVYTEYVRALWQSLSNYLARGHEPFSITAFDKEWYRDFYGEPRAVEEASPEPPARPVMKRAAADTELFRILHRQAAGRTSTAALIEARQPEPDLAMSHRALFAHAQALRDTMQRTGIGPGAVVTVLSQRPLYQAVAIVAGIADGLIVNPLNPALSRELLKAQIDHARPELLIVDGSVAAPEGARTMAWSEVFATVPEHEAEPLPAIQEGEGEDDTGGFLIYTSGTTGASKGVLLGWSQIQANVRHAIGALGFEPGWVTGSLLPRFHTFTLISDLFPALLLGGTTVLAETFDLRNVKWTVDAFLRHGVRSYSAAPVILEALCALNAWADAPALRMAIAGAAPLKETTRQTYAEEFGHPIIPCYGLSETTCFATISPPGAIRAGAVGHPAGIEIRVIDEKGNPIGRGVTGELAMRGPSVISDGYFRDTRGEFAHAFSADGWFKTGDVGRIDEDGYVYVTGRKKNMVIRGGEKVYLEDVDRCLANFLGVLDCASIVLCEPNEPDLALSFIVTSGSPLPVNEVADHVRGALSEHHVPDRIYFVDRIPRTPSGKASHPQLLALSKAMRACREVY